MRYKYVDGSGQVRKGSVSYTNEEEKPVKVNVNEKKEFLISLGLFCITMVVIYLVGGGLF